MTDEEIFQEIQEKSVFKTKSELWASTIGREDVLWAWNEKETDYFIYNEAEAHW